MLENGSDKVAEDELDIDLDNITCECLEDNNYPENSLCSHVEHHDYDVVSTNQYVLSYIAGFIVYKAEKFSTCNECIGNLKTDRATEQHRFIQLMDKGSLQYPSLPLEKLIGQLENAALRVAGQLQIKSNTLYQIVDEVSRLENVPLIGCRDHAQNLTQKIINYYLITRAHFLTKSYNKNNDSKKQKTKSLRKSYKY